MFNINDIVTVKPGVQDPDFGGDIGGWQGRITEINAEFKCFFVILKC
jgi:hypothetical protein